MYATKMKHILHSEHGISVATLNECIENFMKNACGLCVLIDNGLKQSSIFLEVEC
jgi:hypothetical protein